MKKITTAFFRVVSFVPVSLLISILFLTAACWKIYPEARQLAIEMADELKAQICQGPFRPGEPCGDRNVRQEADLGTAIYIYIYGVKNHLEMQALVDTATRLRDERKSSVPVNFTFYADLTKSHKIKTINIKGN